MWKCERIGDLGPLIAIAAVSISSVGFAQTPVTSAAPTAAIYTPRVVVDVIPLRSDDQDVVRAVLPAADPAAWASALDFPEGAQASYGRAIVKLELQTDVNGAVTQCDATVTERQRDASGKWLQGSGVFDWKSFGCGLIRQRARFTPALARDRSHRAGQTRVYFDFEMVRNGSKSPGGLTGMVAPPPPPNIWPPAFQVWAGSLSKTPRLDGFVPAAARAGWTGTTGVQLTVGADGRVSECEVREKSSVSKMDELTCIGLKQARFKFNSPKIRSTDFETVPVVVEWAEGKAKSLEAASAARRPKFNKDVIASLNRTARSNYPRDVDPATANGTTGLEVGFNPDGKVSNCLVTRSAGIDSLDLAACELVTGGDGLVEPGADVFGRPAAGRIAGIEINWKSEDVTGR